MRGITEGVIVTATTIAPGFRDVGIYTVNFDTVSPFGRAITGGSIGEISD